MVKTIAKTKGSTMAPYLPLHFFISYSSEDETAASEIRRYLDSNGIAVWVDSKNIAPGGENFDSALRSALEASFGVVLLASPKSRASPYVQAELAVARSLGLPIVPVWIGGEDWIDSAPLLVTQTQYVDLRGTPNQTRLQVLKSVLVDIEVARKPSHILVTDVYDTWYDHKSVGRGIGFGIPSYVVVALDPPPYDRPKAERTRNERAMVLDPHRFDSLQAVLDVLYATCLQELKEPSTYGSGWLLQGHGKADRTRQMGINPERLLVPWEWLAQSPSPQPYWGRSLPDAYGVVPGSVWYVTEPLRPDRHGHTPREQAFGLAVNNDLLLSEVMAGPGKQPHPPVQGGYLERVAFDEVVPSEYRHLVVALDNWGGRPFAGHVLRETSRVFDPREAASAYDYY